MQHLIYKLLNKFLMNPVEKEILKFFDNKNLTVFDVGCFRGSFTKNLIKFGLKFKIDFNFYLFDPNPNVKNYLSELMESKNIKYFDLALDNTNKQKKFYLNNFFEPSGSSLNTVCKDDKRWNFTRRIILQLLQPYKKLKNFSEIYVKTQTVDDFCINENVKSIDLLKIDTESNELNILKSANNLLEGNKINLIYTEISESKDKFDEKEKNVVDFLKIYNFELIKTYKIRSASILSNIKATDNIFLNKKFNNHKTT